MPTLKEFFKHFTSYPETFYCIKNPKVIIMTEFTDKMDEFVEKYSDVKVNDFEVVSAYRGFHLKIYLED